MERKSSPIELFYCYARKDRVLRDELDMHLAGLRRTGLITAWYDGAISPGTAWQKEIETHLNTAHVILLLVSPDFISSDYCYSKEMGRAILSQQCLCILWQRECSTQPWEVPRSFSSIRASLADGSQ